MLVTFPFTQQTKSERPQDILLLFFSEVIGKGRRERERNDSDVVSTLESAIFLVNGNVCTSL